MPTTTVSFAQITTAVVRDSMTIFGLATNGDVDEYSAAREGWVPLPMVVLRPPAEHETR